MNRAEQLAYLATRPPTRNQVGAIMREFGRLGFDYQADRPARLAACAALAGLDELRSTHDLTKGEAGRLVGILNGLRDRAELAAAVAATSAERPAAGWANYHALIRALADFCGVWERLQKPGR